MRAPDDVDVDARLICKPSLPIKDCRMFSAYTGFAQPYGEPGCGDARKCHLGSLITVEQPMMFGALMQDQENELLTFVENTDLASALSRNRRDKLHVSCELCRVRKGDLADYAEAVPIHDDQRDC